MSNLRAIEGGARPKLSPRLPLTTLYVLVAFSAGFLSEHAKEWSDRYALETAQAGLEKCDTEVLKIQKEFDEAREAFWRAQKP